MRRLALASDAVLMDLRSFSPSNQGCRFELGSLLDSVDLRRVIVLVDAHTDLGHLAATLHELWSRAHPDSPNRPEFPSCVLRPGEAYRSTTLHRFGVEK